MRRVLVSFLFLTVAAWHTSAAATPTASPAVVYAYTNNDLRQPISMAPTSVASIQTVAQESAAPSLAPPASPAPLLVNPELPAVSTTAPHSETVPDILDSIFHTKGDGNGESTSAARPLAAGMPDVTKLVTVLGSLLLVIGLFLLFSLVLRKVSPTGMRNLPKEVFESLGRATLTPKIQLQLLRLGNRLVLVSVTLDGVSAIAEITDPDEVMTVLGMCRRLDANSSTNAFRQALHGTIAESMTFAPPKPTTPRTASPHDLASLLASGLVRG